MSNSEQMIQVCRVTNQMDAEVIRLLLGSRGIPCVVEPGNKVMVEKSKAEEAKRLIERKERGLCLSSNEELVEVCQPVNQIEAEFVRLLLGSKGISCVFKSGYRTTIMVEEPVVKKAKKIIKRQGKGAMFE